MKRQWACCRHSKPCLLSKQCAWCRHCGPVDRTVAQQWACCWNSGPVIDTAWTSWRESVLVVKTVGLLSTHWACCSNFAPDVDIVACWKGNGPVVESVSLTHNSVKVKHLSWLSYCRSRGRLKIRGNELVYWKRPLQPPKSPKNAQINHYFQGIFSWQGQENIFQGHGASCRDSGPDIVTVGLLSKQWAGCQNSGPVVDTVDPFSKQWVYFQESARLLLRQCACCRSSGPVVDTMGMLSRQWWVGLLSRQWACCRDSGHVVNTVGLLSRQWACCCCCGARFKSRLPWQAQNPINLSGSFNRMPKST